MAMTADTSIACIGAGYWGKNQVRNFHALEMLSCVCETSPERRAELAAAYPDAHLTDSFEEVLANPQVDGVAIATPAEDPRQARATGPVGRQGRLRRETPVPLHRRRAEADCRGGDRQMAFFDDVEEKEKLLLYPHSIGSGRTTCPSPTGPRPSRSPSGSVSGIKLLGYALD